MSHAVTITRTTTTTSGTSALIINTGYMKTVPGLLKLAQLVSSQWKKNWRHQKPRPVPKILDGVDWKSWSFPKTVLETFFWKKNVLVLNKFFNFCPQIIGGFCVFFVGWHFWDYSRYNANTELFFLCMAVTFFLGTFCLLVSCLVSLSTGGIISKTIYELVYHSVAFILYLIASILLLMKSSDRSSDWSHPYKLASVKITLEMESFDFNLFLFRFSDWFYRHSISSALCSLSDHTVESKKGVEQLPHSSSNQNVFIFV